MKALFLLIMISFSLMGCSNSPTDVFDNKGNVIYKYDIKGEVNGIPFDGVGVIPYSPNYEMKVISRVDVDLLTISSCHRDFAVESAISVGWFKSKRGYKYQYNPNNIEARGSCLVRFGAYNKESPAQNSWGVLDFETPEEKLPATNLCNGEKQKTKGVSICQSKIGLIQQLIFEVPVKISAKAPGACNLTTKDNLLWQYTMAPSECVMAFQEIDGQKRIHRHTSVGFNQIMIRGDD